MLPKQMPWVSPWGADGKLWKGGMNEPREMDKRKDPRPWRIFY